MANVLIGIISISLFIGLALAGTVFFGSFVGQANTNGAALQYLTAVSTTAGAVSIYNKENQTLMPANTAVNVLLPDYLASMPALANGNTVQLVDTAGATSTNAASFAAVSLGSNSSSAQACAFIANSLTNNQATYASVAAWPGTSTRGCVLLTAAIGPFASGSYVTYAQI